MSGPTVPQDRDGRPSRELHRYDRQMLLPGFGADGQRRLLGSTALILGCGALGTVAADLLARAGIGHLVIIDRDFVELGNLQRQVLFDERDAAEALPKAEAAKRKIACINSQVRVSAIVDDLNHTNIAEYAAGADILVDGLDNFETRYLANDFAVTHAVPYVYGAAVGTAGMSYAILPHTRNGHAPWETATTGSRATPCFRCLFEQAPPPGESPTCDTVGVLGAASAIIANFQVAESLKILTGHFDRVSPTMLNIDLWSNTMTQLKVSQVREHGDCPCCKRHDFEFLDGKAGSSAAALCGRDAVQLRHRQHQGELNLDEIAQRLSRFGAVVSNGFMLRAEIRDNGKPYELTLFADGRAIVKGTGEPSEARGVYARYVGS
jgi:molybdopterin/thiamine biosynthesis adenylyltransferase